MRSLRGFSLVEALVAVVIVAIGLLGVGELTLTGLRESGVALSRTQAVYLISDMMERIRANPDAGDAYDCAGYLIAPVERGCAPSGAPAVPCTARQLAEDDLAQWQRVAQESLSLAGGGPCGANVVYFAAASDATPPRYRVELQWRQPGVDEPFVLVGELLLAEGRAA
jgi:type IV pilus assembly protein PilV